MSTCESCRQSSCRSYGVTRIGRQAARECIGVCATNLGHACLTAAGALPYTQQLRVKTALVITGRLRQLMSASQRTLTGSPHACLCVLRADTDGCVLILCAVPCRAVLCCVTLRPPPPPCLPRCCASLRGTSVSTGSSAVRTTWSLADTTHSRTNSSSKDTSGNVSDTCKWAGGAARWAGEGLWGARRGGKGQPPRGLSV